jgi:hypothetical protein
LLALKLRTLAEVAYYFEELPFTLREEVTTSEEAAEIAGVERSY